MPAQQKGFSFCFTRIFHGIVDMKPPRMNETEFDLLIGSPIARIDVKEDESVILYKRNHST
uniref:Uncharacterized protein n=1 Tax=Utricularia reniformis TaxID=192314 RepID=A0A1Y0AYQ1_9LAMI|nr:hypothetical protein AEK19_MT0417 [Utricularia reniformis]ART30283.1 hypothetical protein AEK19_MT0417 [Utricularia reniformis]